MGRHSFLIMNKMNEPEYQEITCPQCGGTGYTDEEHQPLCDLCQGDGVVDFNTADDYNRRPLIVEYWWNKNGYMVEVDNDD